MKKKYILIIFKEVLFDDFDLMLLSSFPGSMTLHWEIPLVIRVPNFIYSSITPEGQFYKVISLLFKSVCFAQRSVRQMRL